MKKTLALGILALLLIVPTGCNKTEIDETLQEERESQDLLTDEESAILNGEDQEFQEDYLREISDATEEATLNESMALLDELEASEYNKQTGLGAVGSCDAIASSSTCIEYYGSIWTAESAALNCSDSGTFSTSTCPRDYSGGCNTGEGTSADMVAWMYLRGGGEMTAESMGYAKMACDATLASAWIQ